MSSGARTKRVKTAAVSNGAPMGSNAPKSFVCPLKMNTIPHSRETREFFYGDVTETLMRALAESETKLMKVFIGIPETNKEMDVFRIGTLLELVRAMATGIAQDGKRVKVCTQASMGTGIFKGMPLQLAGVRRILEMMDWGDDVSPFVSFGAVGSEEVTPADDVFILIAPQNMVGASIIPDLQAMARAAAADDKPVVLLNPLLVDIPSAGDVMQIRGREERMNFAKQFKEVYHFRLLYRKPYMHPIYGLLRHAFGGEWEVYKRVVKKTEQGKQEKYCFADTYNKEPTPAQITDAIAKTISF